MRLNGNGLAWLAVGLCWAVPVSASVSGDEPGRAVPLQGNDHLQSPGSPHTPYQSLPPTSGPHVPWLAPWGMHRIPVLWEVQVHNLEDGGIIIHYRCDRPCPETMTVLEHLLTEYPTQVLVTPEPSLSSAFALTAWGRIATIESWDEGVVRRFIEAYRGQDHHPPSEQEGASKRRERP